MTGIRWFGVISLLLLAFFYAAAAVWSHVGNSVMMGILVGDAFVNIWGFTALVFAALATACYAGTKMVRATLMMLFTGLLAVFYLSYTKLQQGEDIGALFMAWSVLVLVFALKTMPRQPAQAIRTI